MIVEDYFDFNIYSLISTVSIKLKLPSNFVVLLKTLYTLKFFSTESILLVLLIALPKVLKLTSKVFIIWA